MFLIERDFNRILNNNDISILLEESELYSDEVLNESIDFAIEFVKSKLQHRYDPDQIFINVNSFDLTTTYNENDLIIYTEQDFDTLIEYTSGDRVNYQNRIYEANTTTTIGTFDPDEWDLKANNNSFYYCIAESFNNYPNDTDYFTKGDLRNALIRDYTMKIAIKELFMRVQPRVFPSWVIDEYTRAEDHLTRVSNGKDTLLLPVKLDADGEQEGHNITYGSQIQRNWEY